MLVINDFKYFFPGFYHFIFFSSNFLYVVQVIFNFAFSQSGDDPILFGQQRAIKNITSQLGISDEEFSKEGCKIEDRENVLNKSDIIFKCAVLLTGINSVKP